MAFRPTAFLIRETKDMTPEEEFALRTIVEKHPNEVTRYEAGVSKLKEMFGWRLPDAHHLIHTLLNRAIPSIKQSIVIDRVIQGWLMDFRLRVHDTYSCVPNAPHARAWLENIGEFFDPETDAKSQACYLGTTLFDEGYVILPGEHGYSYKPNERISAANAKGEMQVSDSLEASIERYVQETTGKIDLVTHPPPMFHGLRYFAPRGEAYMDSIEITEEERAITNTILLRDHVGCTWEELLTAPEPWAVSPEISNLAQQWLSDGTWEKMKKPFKIEKLLEIHRKDNPEPFSKRRRKTVATDHSGNKAEDAAEVTVE